MNNPQKRLRFLITAGPTVEPIDPVRFLSNRSSGKMGFALANQAKKLGHEVILVAGPTQLKAPKNVNLISIQTALEMHDQVLKNFVHADIIIKAAAVCDFRPQNFQAQKIKKEGIAENWQLNLVRNPDILAKLGQLKQKQQLLVGFAAESEDIKQNATKKLAAKNLDWIVANDISQSQTGFQADENEAWLIGPNEELFLPRTSKENLAKQIVQFLAKQKGF